MVMCLRAGIGQGRVTDNLAQDIDLLDGALHIPDADTIRMIYHLLDRDGLYVGASTALNVVAAKKLAEKLGKGSRVVTCACRFRRSRDKVRSLISPMYSHRLSAPRRTGTNRDCSPRSGSSQRSSSRRSPNTSKSMSCFLRRAASKQSPVISCEYIFLPVRLFLYKSSLVCIMLLRRNPRSGYNEERTDGCDHGRG